MTREQTIIRVLATYGLILPLAIFLGYLLADPLQRTSITVVLFIVLVLLTPILLRFHHPLLFLSWNMTAVVPFLPGRPQFWLLMTAVSITISMVQYALTRRERFSRAPSVLWPLLFIGAVVFSTAMLTGGIGLRIVGGEKIGGKGYILMLAGIVGYIAMTAHRIPASKANLYLGLFLLGALANGIGNFLPYAPQALYPLFSIFPVETQGVAAVLTKESFAVRESVVTRFSGFSLSLMALAFYLIARMGLNALLNPRRMAFWVFILAVASSTLGGFRSYLITILMLVTICFFLEGLHKTNKMPALLLTLALVAAGMLAFVQHLPISMQRSLSFLPIQVDPVAEMSAKGTTEWRMQMWMDLLPEVPRHLLLGKGLLVSAGDLDMADNLASQGRGDTAEVAMLAGDYHSGPLSVLIPFGIWGLVGWLWFTVVAIRALYFNYVYSDPELKKINRFFFAYFITKVAVFHLIIGAFDTHFMFYAGILGFSVALNDGIRQPVRKAVNEQTVRGGSLARPRLIPSFSRLSQR